MQEIILSTLGHTWILDLDGTIVKHNGYKIDDEDTLLQGASDFIKNIPAKDMIIFITSRDTSMKSRTEKFLSDHNIRFDAIIYNAPLGERILINDNKPSGLPMAHAIPRKRDDWEDIRIIEDSSL